MIAQRVLQEFNDECNYLLTKYIQATAPVNGEKVFNKTHYYKLIDESSSVTQGNFKLMTSCLSKQVQVLDFGNEDENSPNKVSIFKFNQSTTEVLKLCSNKQLILDTLSTLNYAGGNTNSSKALETVYDRIKKTKNSNTAHNIILLLTDGDLKGTQAILKKIANDTVLSIKIVFMFVNTPIPKDFFSEYQVEERHVIHFRDFRMMEKVFEHLVLSKAHETPNIQDLTPSAKNIRVYFSSASPIWPIDYYAVEVYGKNDNESPLIATRSRFDELLIDSLNPGTTYRLRACSHYSNGLVSGWTEFVPFTTFTVRHIEEVLQDPEELMKKHAQLLHELLNSKPNDKQKMMGSTRLNVAIFGPMQHGKSAWICTGSSTFAGKYQTPAKSLYNPNQTVTTEIKQINILNSPAGTNHYMAFMDTFGIRYKSTSLQDNETNHSLFRETNYSDCLAEFLSGRLPPGFQEGDKLDDNKLLNHVTIDNKIHAIAFIVDILAIQQDSQMKIVKDFLQELINTYGYKPLIIFTKCDVIMQGDLPKNTKPRVRDIYENKTLIEAMHHFIDKVEIVDKSDIMLFANYITKYDPIEEREYDKELLMLDILDNLKQRGEAFIEDYFRNYVQVFTEDGNYLGNFEVIKQADLVSNYGWKFLGLLKNNDITPSEGFSIKYIDFQTKKERFLKPDEFDKMQIREVLFNDFDYPRVVIKLQQVVQIMYKPQPTPKPLSNGTPMRIKELVLKMEGDTEYFGFLEDIDGKLTLRDLRSQIEDEYKRFDFDFIGQKNEYEVKVSQIVQHLQEDTYLCILRKKTKDGIQKVKILDGTTNEQITDIEVPNLEVNLLDMQRIIKAQVGEFSFVRMIAGSKAPTSEKFVANKKLKDLLSGKDETAQILFIRKT